MRINKEFEKAKILGKKLGIPVFADAFRGQESRRKITFKKCFAPFLSAVVCADKHVYGCCDLRYRQEYDFGEIKTSFSEIWNSSRRKRVLAKIAKLECAKHCGFRFNYYNDIIRYLRLKVKPHVDFI